MRGETQLIIKEKVSHWHIRLEGWGGSLMPRAVTLWYNRGSTTTSFTVWGEWNVKRHNEGAGGFTFLEIIVVVVILMILAGWIIPRNRIGVGRGEIMEDGSRYEGRATKVKIQMEEIAKALHLYKLDSGFYPTTEQGLLALVEEPSKAPRPRRWRQYLDNVPYDPWAYLYLYKCPDIMHNKNAAGYLRVNAEIYDNFVLTSTGADGVEGSKDDIRIVVDDEFY